MMLTANVDRLEFAPTPVWSPKSWLVAIVSRLVAAQHARRTAAAERAIRLGLAAID